MKTDGTRGKGAGNSAGLDLSDEILALDNQLCFELYSASRKLIRSYRPFLAKLGLTYPQYLALLVLWEWDRLDEEGVSTTRNGRSVKALGERLQLDSGTLTPLLKRLQLSGLVTRSRSSADERVVEIALTAAGRALKKKAREIPIKLFCQLEQPAEKLLRLKELLRQFADAIPDETA